MKKIAFITPASVKYGFSLSGIPQIVADTETIEETLKKTMDDAETGLVVVDERLVSGGREGGLSGERMRELERQWPGVLLILPSPEKPPAESDDYAARLIRRAIGYHVRLKI